MNAKLVGCAVTAWDDAYAIGHEKIDSEHKRLFDIAAEIYEHSNDSEKIIKIVKELVLYTKFHFKNEEDFMKSINFIDLDNHKKLHKKVIDELNIIIKNINSQPIEESVVKLNTLVNKNILQHILIEDKKVHHAIRTRDELKENFKWKIDYKLGNELLDDEHQQLFDIAENALNYNNTDIKSHIKITICELYDYMRVHFEDEEKYMEEIAYPELEEHKILHESIIHQMNDFVKQLSTLSIIEFEKKLIEYMDIWLINHILYEDRKIIKFVKE
ncbi:bacteriohemerythrin [Arcobacter sp. LA11]|uniref:bacteriohemerythrin n=1 Tax=Arcobacter sp. LA11 TaxID=1898176 RepID=UPI000934FEF6|nr:hemerythrin domain-containing protein [Arcobacter sp. LA11]